MDQSRTLNHSKWECKYHVVFIPKYRRKALYKELRRHLGSVFRELASAAEVCSGSGDPTYQGKSAIHIARKLRNRTRNFVEQHVCERGYYVSTVGRDEMQEVY